MRRVDAAAFPSDGFGKACHFSPDGLLLLVATEDRGLLRFVLPQDTFVPQEEEAADAAPRGAWSPWVASTCPEAINDCAWYPRFSANDGATAVFASVCADQPITLHEVGGGAPRAVYCGHNRLDELARVFSLAFTPDGTQLLAGCDSSLLLFDISRPGREAAVWATTPFRKSKSGQHGLIGAIAASCDGTTLAAGSYEGSTWLYDVRTGGAPTVKLKTGRGRGEGGPGPSRKRARGEEGVEGGPAGDAKAGVEHTEPPAPAPSPGQEGVTRLQWDTAGERVYAGYRQCDVIRAWDVRQPGEPVLTFARSARTHQRIGFELHPSGSTLLTGGRDGAVRAYSTIDGGLLGEQQHGQCVGGVSVHPAGIVHAVCTGERWPRNDDASPPSSEGEGAAPHHRDISRLDVRRPAPALSLWNGLLP